MTTEQREAALKLAREIRREYDGSGMITDVGYKVKTHLLSAALDDARELLAVAVKAIQDAPHEPSCLWEWGPRKCDCWKARAVAQILPASKAAEPVEVSDDFSDMTPGILYRRCQNCESRVEPEDNFCGHCGRAIKWV